MDEFIKMGGYGAYVWPAYGLSAVVLTGLVISVFRRAAKARRDLATLESRRKDKSDG